VNAVEKQFSKFREAVQSALSREDRETWRKQFATSLVAYARTVTSRDAFLDGLDKLLPHLGMTKGLFRLGSGSTRSTFAMPFDLVLKMELDPSRFAFKDGPLLEHGFLKEGSGNFAEIERAERLPGLVPRVYGHCLRFFDHAEQTLHFIVSEQVVPLRRYMNAATTVFRAPAEEFGVRLGTNQLVLMDAGGDWRDLDGDALKQLESTLAANRMSTDGRIDPDALLAFGECQFGQFRGQSIGARYGDNLEELRKVFSEHLLRFAGVCSNASDLVRHLAEFLPEACMRFDSRPFVTGSRADAYRLPFDLALVVVHEGVRVDRLQPESLSLYGSEGGGAERHLPAEVILGHRATLRERDAPAYKYVLEISASNRVRRNMVTATPRGALSVMVVEDPRDDARKAAELVRIVNDRTASGSAA
jgi:hypothetical protein